MKIAVFSDIHDNLKRWQEAALEIRNSDIKIGICCGDVQNIEALKIISKNFQRLYLAMGNADFDLKQKTELIPDNVVWSDKILEIKLKGKKIAIVHSNHVAQELLKNKKHNLIFYGHTHTPWQEQKENVIALNPGEICGRYGHPSFAVFDLLKMKPELKILK